MRRSFRRSFSVAGGRGFLAWSKIREIADSDAGPNTAFTVGLVLVWQFLENRDWCTIGVGDSTSESLKFLVLWARFYIEYSSHNVIRPIAQMKGEPIRPVHFLPRHTRSSRIRLPVSERLVAGWYSDKILPIRKYTSHLSTFFFKTVVVLFFFRPSFVFAQSARSPFQENERNEWNFLFCSVLDLLVRFTVSGQCLVRRNQREIMGIIPATAIVSNANCGKSLSCAE